MAGSEKGLVMNYTVKILSIAKKDLEVAKKWYNDQKVGLGEEFKTEINEEIERIGKSPEQYQIKYKDLRQAVIRRFPYVIYYLLEEEKNRVIIFGVLHTSRKQKIMQLRRK